MHLAMQLRKLKRLMLPTHQVVAVSVHPEEVAGHEGALEVVLHVGADGHTDGSKMRHLDRGAGRRKRYY